MRNSCEPGKWIWTASGVRQAQEEQPERNSYARFRKLFNLPSGPATALIRVAANSKYKLYINGEYVGKGPARAPAGAAYYDTHDITRFLSKGANVIALLVHYFGETTYAGPPGKPGLNCSLEVECESGLGLVVVSDETWKACRAPDWTDQGDRINDAHGFQEVYDAGARIDGWNQVKFKDDQWEHAAVVTGPDPRPRPVPQLREERILPKTVVGTFNCNPRGREARPQAIPQAMSLSALSPLTAGSVKGVNSLLKEDGVTQVRSPRGEGGVAIILDFGREVFGNVEIGIARSSGGCIDIGYGELLEDGRVKPDRLGSKYTDRIILGRGRFRWQSFEPRAFRYMQIEFRWLGRPIEIDYVCVNETTYPVRRTGNFECSDSLLNQIWRTAACTTELCMEDTLISSPWRDRSRGWADVRVAARAAYYAFGDTALLAQALREVAESQADDGSLPGIRPPVCSEEPSADLMLLWVLSLLEYYAFSDDLELVRTLYPTARRLMEWFGAHLGDDHLLRGVPGSLFIDDADLERRGIVTALNCLYCHSLRATGALAQILGLQTEAEQWQATADRVRPAINKYLYSPPRGLYADCLADGELVEKYTFQTNILAALFDIADHYRMATILRQIRTGALPQPVTTYMGSYLVEAFCAADLHGEALDLTRRLWGSLVGQGATTFGERFDGQGSLCRAWSVSPARDLLAEYVGIKPTLGAARFTVAPHTAGLAWARGSINTDAGPLAVEWKSTRRHLLINVDVPPEVRVDVYPPGTASSRITLDGADHPSRFITLDSGSHTIRVAAAPPPRPPRTDRSLEPRPVPHVEILAELFPRGYGRLRVGGRQRAERKAAARSRKPRERPAVTRDEETPAEVVTEQTASATAAEIDTETAPRESPPVRPRRGTRRRSGTKTAKPEKKSSEAQASGSAAPAAPPPEPQMPEEGDAGQPRKGSRTRKPRRAAEPQVRELTTAEPAFSTPPAEPEPTAEPVPTPSRPRRRRRPAAGRPAGDETSP
ncbi:MAG: family 78 glycoside hydrolase catalytic domain [Armatimonadota bacterium]